MKNVTLFTFSLCLYFINLFGQELKIIHNARYSFQCPKEWDITFNRKSENGFVISIPCKKSILDETPYQIIFQVTEYSKEIDLIRFIILSMGTNDSIQEVYHQQYPSASHSLDTNISVAYIEDPYSRWQIRKIKKNDTKDQYLFLRELINHDIKYLSLDHLWLKENKIVYHIQFTVQEQLFNEHLTEVERFIKSFEIKY